MNEWPQKITKEMYNSLLDYENPIQNTVSSKGYFNYYCYNQYLYEFTNSAFITRCKLLVTIKDRNAKKRRHSSTSPVTFSRGSIIVWTANGTSVYSESKCWYKRLCEFCGDICWDTWLYQHQWKKKWTAIAVFFSSIQIREKMYSCKKYIFVSHNAWPTGEQRKSFLCSISWQITGQKQMSDVACLTGDSQRQTDKTRLSFIDSHICWYCLGRLMHDIFSFAICSLT